MFVVGEKRNYEDCMSSLELARIDYFYERSTFKCHSAVSHYARRVPEGVYLVG